MPTDEQRTTRSVATTTPKRIRMAGGLRLLTSSLLALACPAEAASKDDRDVSAEKSPMSKVVQGNELPAASQAAHGAEQESAPSTPEPRSAAKGDLRTSFTSQPCEPGEGDSIVICRRLGEKYRLLPSKGFDPKGPVDSVLRERSRLLEGGESGIHSCNFVVGAGSWTGCELKAIERARQQGRQVSRFGDIRLGR